MACELQCTNVQLWQCQEIIRAHKYSVPSPEALWAKLHEGVLIDGNKYFWLDNKDRLCVELYARALNITWESVPRYWTYSYEQIPKTEYKVEIAKLVDVCWFDVKWEYDMRNLAVGAEYEIFFDIELSEEAEGWIYPVTFEHNSFGLKRKFERRLDDIIGRGRTQISMGKFKVPCLSVGTRNATFRVHEHSDYSWKSGLIVSGVIIKAT